MHLCFSSENTKTLQQYRIEIETYKGIVHEQQNKRGRQQQQQQQFTIYAWHQQSLYCSPQYDIVQSGRAE